MPKKLKKKNQLYYCIEI